MILIFPTSLSATPDALYVCLFAPVREVYPVGTSPSISSTETTRHLFSLIFSAVAVIVTLLQPAGVKTDALYSTVIVSVAFDFVAFIVSLLVCVIDYLILNYNKHFTQFQELFYI